MNRFPRLLVYFIVAAFVGGSAFAQMTGRESKRISQGKITKNEAQHLVMQQFPGAKISKCELRNENKHSVWVLDVMKPGSKNAMQVQVDGTTGKLLNAPSTQSSSTGAGR